ncbi:neuroligin-1-like [Frankliniella occidentalis]|uniref:Neuroligin-1-like n=1 Tax=Frankliniella occidentalis TaxID=133901 RepID=A0A6J1T7J2_FRAOC|nr:neuroligin-1-like [Frankliniella occidentalis]XP_052125398.1 neuroligin-1-like [Frankliniella occidentalis]
MRYRLPPVQCPGVLAGAVVLLLLSAFSGGSSTSSGLPTRKISTRLARTKYGLLRGVILQQQPVEAFLGVPYATAPLGSLRYMPPVTPSMWKTPRLCDTFSPVCPQRAPSIGNRTEALLEFPRGRLVYLEKLLPLLANQSEDCLYMNIYVPQEADFDSASLPTVVYVHGESYEWNSGNPYDGSVLAAHGRLIVITLNFRLGILGE